MIPTGSRAFIVLLGALTAMTSLSIDMSLPAMPLLAQVFGAEPGTVQLTLSGFMLAFGLAQLVCGPLADRFGRKPVLLGGLALYIAGSIGAALSPSIAILIACRAMQGAGACCGPLLGRTMVRDLYSGEDASRLMSYMIQVMSVAPLVAPMIGGHVAVWFGWRAIFVALGVTGALLATAAAIGLPETLRTSNPDALRPGRLLGNYRRALVHPHTLRALVVNACVFAGLFSFISSAPFIAIDIYGIRMEQFGYVFAGAALAIGVGAMLNSQLVRRRGTSAMLRSGLLTVISGAALLGLVTLVNPPGPLGLGLLIAAAMIYILGVGMVGPNTAATALEPFPDMAGAVSALMGAGQTSASALAGFVVTSAFDHTTRPLAVMMGACGLFAAMLGLGIAKPKHRTPAEEALLAAELQSLQDGG